jgi:hypothetical protein
MSHVYEEDTNFNYLHLGLSSTLTIQEILSTFSKAYIHLLTSSDNIEKTKRNTIKYQENIRYVINNYPGISIQVLEDMFSDIGVDAFIDYCVVESKGTPEENALTFFLIDKMLKTHGYIDFVDESFADIIHLVVSNHERYKECVKDKVYQKTF